MGLMVIIENKIKLVTGVKGVVFSPCYIDVCHLRDEIV